MHSPARPAFHPQADDTAPDIERRLIGAYRAMSPAEKATRIAEDSRAVEQLALAGIAWRQPGGSPEAMLLALAGRRFAPSLLERAYPGGPGSQRRRPMSTPSDPVALALHVAGILDALGIASVVGGSIASSVFGEPRATEDVDFVADLRADDVERVVAALTGEFYVDGDAIRRAVDNHSSFNIIHLPTARKVDIFVPPENAVAQAQLVRRTLVTVSEEAGTRLHLLTPEDVVLQKLLWYRKGGEVSDRQWRDVLGVLKVQADAVDWRYLGDMAAQAGLAALLDRARSEASGS